MRIKLKRNQNSASNLPVLEAGEPLWFKDQLYIGSVGGTAVGAGTQESGGVLSSGSLIKIWDPNSRPWLEDGFTYPRALNDADGNWYRAVVIGNQVWLAENWRCTRLPDGTPLVRQTGEEEADFSDTEARYFDWSMTFAWYRYRYGLLYNGVALMNGADPSEASPSGVQGLAPSGWHIPSAAEFTTLTEWIKSQPRYRYTDYGVARALSTDKISRITTADDGNKTGLLLDQNNRSGFDLAYGGRFYSGYNTASRPTYRAYLWTASESSVSAGDLAIFSLGYTNDEPSLTTYAGNRKNFYSVRLLSDRTPQQFWDWYTRNYGAYYWQQSEPRKLWVDHDVSSLLGSDITPTEDYLSSSNSWLHTYSAIKKFLIPLNNIIRVKIKARPSDSAIIAFCKGPITNTNSSGTRQQATVVSGHGWTTVPAGTEQSFEVPSEAEYLYVAYNSGSYGVNINIPDYIYFTGSGITEHTGDGSGFIKDNGSVDHSTYALASSIPTNVSDLPNDANYIGGPSGSSKEDILTFNNTAGNLANDSGITIRRLWDEKDISDRISYQQEDYPYYNGLINSSNQWASASGTQYSYLIIPLDDIRKIRVTSYHSSTTDRYSAIAFLRSYTPIPTDGETPDFATGYNERIVISSEDTSIHEYDVPVDAKFLYIYRRNTSVGSYCPSYLAFTGIGITEYKGDGTGFIKDDGTVDKNAYITADDLPTDSDEKVTPVQLAEGDSDFQLLTVPSRTSPTSNGKPNYCSSVTVNGNGVIKPVAMHIRKTGLGDNENQYKYVNAEGEQGITLYTSAVNGEVGQTPRLIFKRPNAYVSFDLWNENGHFTIMGYHNGTEYGRIEINETGNIKLPSSAPTGGYISVNGTASGNGGFFKSDGSIDNNSYIPVAPSALGSATKPIYLSSNSVFSECSTYAGGTAVTLNGESKAASTASFYSPTSAGTSGQYLKSNGSGAPTWADLPADSDTKVTQTKTTDIYTLWRPLIIGRQYASSAPTASTALNFDNPASDPTDIVYSTHLGGFQPSTGTLAVVGIKKLTDDGKLDGSDTKLWNTNGGIVTIGASGGPAAFSHTHGNITNDGKIGSIANLPLITGSNGVVTTGSFGTSSGTFCEGNDSRLSDARTPNNDSNLVHKDNAETITGLKTFTNGLILNTGTSWTNTDRAIPFSKSGDPETIQYVYDNATKGLTFNPNTGELKAAKFTKRNGTKAQILLANGDNIDAGTSGYYLKANGIDSAPTWTQFPTIPTVPTNVSAFNNDAGYLTSFTETDPTVPAWAKATNKPSYSYSEITGTPTNVSAFTNDAAYITLRDLPTDMFGTVFVDTSAATKAKTATVPYTYTLRTGNTFILHLNVANTNTAATLNINGTGAKSVRINGAAPTSSNWAAGLYLCYYDGTYYQMYTAKNPYNYEDLINQPTIPTVPTNVSAFTNDANYVTGNISGQVVTIGANSITIPTVPTNVSAFTNDAGYLTSHQSIDKIISSTAAQTAPSSALSLAGGDTLTLHKVSWTGTYSDLIGTPSIPDPANDADINVSNGTTSKKLTSTDNNTAKTLIITGSKGITIGTPTLSGNTLTIDISHSHADISAGTNIGGNTNDTPGYGDTFNVPYFSYDAQGHITASGIKTVKIPASDNTDEKVKQQYYASSEYTNWRPIPLGYSSGSSYSFTPSTETQGLYTFNTILAQPSTGSIRAGRFIKTSANYSTGILLADGSDIPQSTFLTSFTETDPTVPAWAKATNKPSYNLDEVLDGTSRKLLVLGSSSTTAAAGNHTHEGVYQPAGNYLTAESNGFGKVSVAAQSTGTSNLSGTTSATTLNSDSAADTLNIATGNKWIQIKAEGASAASTADTDKLTFGHIVPGVGTTGGSVRKFDYDAAGHITAVSTPTASDLTDIIGNAYSATDEKVTPEAVATSTAYPMLLASSDSTPTTNGKPKYSANLSATGTGDVVFTKSNTTGTIQYDGTDKCFKFIFS